MRAIYRRLSRLSMASVVLLSAEPGSAQNMPIPCSICLLSPAFVLFSYSLGWALAIASHLK